MFGRAGIITTMTFCIELALGVSIVGDCQNTVSFSILILIFSTEHIHVVYISSTKYLEKYYTNARNGINSFMAKFTCLLIFWFSNCAW